MRIETIDCQDEDWKSRLKLNLQEETGVDLIHFDYTVDGPFCEMLALSHSYDFRLDAKNRSGHYKKRSAK